MSKSHKIYDLFFQIVEYVSVIFLFAMVVICAANVFMRYVLQAALRWGDEIALFCMIWYSMLSAAVALKENRHIRVGIWDNIFKGKIKTALNLITYGIVFLILVCLCFYSFKLVALTGNTRMTGSGLRLAYEYMALPISTIFMLIATVGRMGEILGWK